MREKYRTNIRVLSPADDVKNDLLDEQPVKKNESKEKNIDRSTSLESLVSSQRNTDLWSIAFEIHRCPSERSWSSFRAIPLSTPRSKHAFQGVHTKR